MCCACWWIFRGRWRDGHARCHKVHLQAISRRHPLSSRRGRRRRSQQRAQLLHALNAPPQLRHQRLDLRPLRRQLRRQRAVVRAQRVQRRRRVGVLGRHEGGEVCGHEARRREEVRRRVLRGCSGAGRGVRVAPAPRLVDQRVQLVQAGDDVTLHEDGGEFGLQDRVSSADCLGGARPVWCTACLVRALERRRRRRISESSPTQE